MEVADHSTLSDEALAARAQLDQGDWLQELFRRFERRMLGCAHRMVAPREVEDAVQEISLRIMQGLPSFRGDSSVATWVYSVARYTCLDVRRRRRDVQELDESALTGENVTETPEAAFEDSILACRTALAIQTLPLSQQDVVLLRLGGGLSTAETAAQLKISEDAVKARLRRARARLRSELRGTIACPACGPGAYALLAHGVHDVLADT